MNLKLPRKKRVAIQQKREILAAAERVFSEKGFFTTKIQDIAIEAEYGIGTIYKHFTSKDLIFFALIKNKFNEMIAYAEKNVQNQKSPINKLRALVYSHLEFFEKNKKIFRLLSAEHVSFEKNLRARFIKEMRRNFLVYFEIFYSIYTTGVQAGIFRSEKRQNLFYFCISLIGMINFTAFYKLNNTPEESLLDNATLIFDLFLKGVKKG